MGRIRWLWDDPGTCEITGIPLKKVDDLRITLIKISIFPV